MYASPYLYQTLFAPEMPNAKLLDVKSDVTDLTTYTFSACNIGSMGGTPSLLDTYGTDPSTPRAPSRKIILVCVHSEDALTAFTVSTCSIGGQNGIIRADGSGTSQTVSTAIVAFTTDQLQGIANTDVVVTFSEAVQTCAIGIIEVTNLGLNAFFRANTANGTGDMLFGADSTNVNCDSMVFSLYATTCATASIAETIQWRSPDATVIEGAVSPMLLYEDGNAEMSYAAVWQYCPSYNGTASGWAGGCTLNWSGAGVGDAVSVHFA